MKRSFFKQVPVLVLTVALCGTAIAEDAAAPAKKWKNETEASLVSANGNTKSTTSAGKNTFLYNWAKTALEVIGGGHGSKSEGRNTAEKYFASEKVSYKLSDRNYVFEKYAWDKDRFAGIKSRHDGTVGFGRELIKNDRNLLIAELGSGWIKEDRIGSKNIDFASGRAYTKFEHTLSPTSKFSQDVEYLQNYENPDDFRAKTESAVTAALSAHFSLKLAYTWQHVGEPPLGFSRNDTFTTIALLATY